MTPLAPHLSTATFAPAISPPAPATATTRSPAARATSLSPAASTFIRARSKSFSRNSRKYQRQRLFAVADRVRGEVPVAYIVANGTVNCDAIAERCRAKLASFKIPRDFITVDKLPRNALGKDPETLAAQSAGLRSSNLGLSDPILGRDLLPALSNLFKFSSSATRRSSEAQRSRSTPEASSCRRSRCARRARSR